MKKILLLLIASMSCASLMGMGDQVSPTPTQPTRSICDACCDCIEKVDNKCLRCVIGSAALTCTLPTAVVADILCLPSVCFGLKHPRWTYNYLKFISN